MHLRTLPLLLLPALTLAQLVYIPFEIPAQNPGHAFDTVDSHRHDNPNPDQHPLAAKPDTMPGDVEPLMADKPAGPPLLGDILPLDRSVSIFSSLSRTVPSIETRLSSPSTNSTVLAPLDTALHKLPRKPWEDPAGAASAQDYVGIEGEDRAGRNLRRFVEAHVVEGSGWGEGERRRTVEGGEVWWEEKGGRRRVMPGGVEVERVNGGCGNGEVWVVRGVVDYDA